MPTYFRGTRGTGSFVTDQRPKSWREMILTLYPNGKAPLTALLSKFAKEQVTDPEFYWWTKTMAHTAGSVTGKYTDAAMATAYVSGGVAGSILYIKVAEALAKGIRAGHQIVLRYTLDSRVDCVAKVIQVTVNGANSQLVVRLLEADDNSATYDLSDADYLMVIGNSNPEGGEMPSGIQTDPSKLYNLCQIFRTSLYITRTARKTKLRTGDQYQQAKAEALEMHSIEMELNTLFGVLSERTGDNGQPERTTMGIIPFVRANAPANFDDFRYNASYSGTTWLASGEDYLDTMFEQLSRYASLSEMVFLAGSGALLGINRMIKNGAQYNLTGGETIYGIQVNKWMTPFGTANLITHPLFSADSTMRNLVVGVTPRTMKFRYIDDTEFYSDDEKQNTGHGRLDATAEEYLTEGGYEYEHPEKFIVLNGVGSDCLV